MTVRHRERAEPDREVTGTEDQHRTGGHALITLTWRGVRATSCTETHGDSQGRTFRYTTSGPRKPLAA